MVSARRLNSEMDLVTEAVSHDRHQKQNDLARPGNDQLCRIEGQTSASGETIRRQNTTFKPPDGGWGWVVCFACFLGNFCGDGIVYSFGILIKPISEHFDAPMSSVAVIGSVINVIGFGLGPITSLLVDRFGARPVCITGGLMCIAGFSLSVLSPNMVTLFALYAVVPGIGLGLFYLPSIVSCNLYFDKKMSLANGLSLSGGCVGGLVLAPLANFMVETYGWKSAILAFAGVMSLVVIEGCLLKPMKPVLINEVNGVSYQDSRLAPVYKSQTLLSQNLYQCPIQSERRHSADGSVLFVAPGFQPLKIKSQRKLSKSAVIINCNEDCRISDPFLVSNYIKNKDNGMKSSYINDKPLSSNSEATNRVKTKCDLKWLTNPIFILLGLNTFSMTLGLYIPHCFLSDLATSVPQLDGVNSTTYYLSTHQGATLISLINIGNLVGRIVSGAIVDLPFLDIVFVYNITHVSTAIFMMSFPLATSYSNFAILATGYGLSMSSCSSQISVVLAEVFGISALNSTFGIVSFLRGLSFLGSWPLAGLVYEAMGTRKAIFILGAAQLGLGGLFGFLMQLMANRRRRAPNDQSTK